MNRGIVMRSATPVETRIPSDYTDGGGARAHVDLRGVSLIYGEGEKRTLAVEGLDLQLRRGEFVAVVGPSGSGKSTLMKLVTGLIQPDAGEVYYNGERVAGPVKH